MSYLIWKTTEVRTYRAAVLLQRCALRARGVKNAHTYTKTVINANNSVPSFTTLMVLQCVPENAHLFNFIYGSTDIKGFYVVGYMACSLVTWYTMKQLFTYALHVYTAATLLGEYMSCTIRIYEEKLHIAVAEKKYMHFLHIIIVHFRSINITPSVHNRELGSAWASLSLVGGGCRGKGMLHINPQS